MRLAWGIALLSCFVSCSCGTARSERPAEEPPPVPGPPIEAIDEPAGEDVAYMWSIPRDNTGYQLYWCLDGDPAADDEPCDPSPADIEKLRRQQEAVDEAIKPAKGAEPRAIARLRLTARGPKSFAFLIAWRNRAGKLCLADTEEDEEGGGGWGSGGPSGPCVPEGHCRDICLSLSGSGSGQEELYTTSGVVTSKADALRITFDDGRVVTYELSGPIVPGFPEYRVFMLDLGRGLEARLELLQKERVIAEEKRPRAELRAMRCSERFPMTPASSEEDREKAWRACIREAGSD